MLECKIASHTYIVGPWQSGLHTIKPDEEPTWDIDEGIYDNKKMISMPWSPNTIFCLTGKIPEGWQRKMEEKFFYTEERPWGRFKIGRAHV